MLSFRCGSTTVKIKIGDITEEEADAIVCPANSFGHMRGGVAAIIRQVGGDAIEREFLAKAPIQVGNAVITGAGKLKSRYVIHAPTMRIPVDSATISTVRMAVRAALTCAQVQHLKTIVFPGMGTGTGLVSYADAASVMIDEIQSASRTSENSLISVTIIARSDEFLHELVEVAKGVLQQTG